MMSGKMLVVHDLDTVKMAFRALDESGSGFVSYKQLKYLLVNIGKTPPCPSSHLIIIMSSGDKLTEQEAEDFLAEIDISKDGVIDYKEFLKMLTGN